MDIYNFSVKAADGKEISLSDYRGKILLIVNTASKCGFTPQYEELEKLYQNYKNSGLEILAFPCNQFHNQEPEDDVSIQEFCRLQYGVSFPVFQKIEVNGKEAIPLYRFLTENTKFRGFDRKHPLAEKLESILKAENPDYEKTSDIKWNFTKFLIDQDGKILERLEPTESIEKIEQRIKEVI